MQTENLTLGRWDHAKEMDGLPVIIRLLDPPLHEFQPSKEELLVEVTRMETTGEIGQAYEAKKSSFPSLTA
jgi:phosphoenolpyruvate synthase/pyruvate phosphate dikinase